jgi:hypothetical protein
MDLEPVGHFFAHTVNWPLVGGILIGVFGGGLGGTLITKRIDFQHEKTRRQWTTEDEANRHKRDTALAHERWVRDQRLKAYVEFGNSLDELLHRVAEVDGKVPMTLADFDNELTQLQEFGRAMTQHSGAVALVGPDIIADRAYRLQEDAWKLVGMLNPQAHLLNNPACAKAMKDVAFGLSIWRAAAKADLNGTKVTKIPTVEEGRDYVANPPQSEEAGSQPNGDGQDPA